MAHTPAFFRCVVRATGLLSPAPTPARYPYHDRSECPTGRQVKASGEWQYYDPTKAEKKRDRCPHCAELEQAH